MTEMLLHVSCSLHSIVVQQKEKTRFRRHRRRTAYTLRGNNQKYAQSVVSQSCSAVSRYLYRDETDPSCQTAVRRTGSARIGNERNIIIPVVL